MSEFSHKPRQMELDIVEPAREVEWWNAHEEGRKKWFGQRTIKIVKEWDAYMEPSTTAFHASRLSEIEDPALRYALRFKDAMNAIGSVSTSETSSTSGNVTVYATNEGLKSRLLCAHYSDGTTEKFLEWLIVQGRSDSDENYRNFDSSEE